VTNDYGPKRSLAGAGFSVQAVVSEVARHGDSGLTAVDEYTILVNSHAFEIYLTLSR